jgi:hypothetical protein
LQVDGAKLTTFAGTGVRDAYEMNKSVRRSDLRGITAGAERVSVYDPAPGRELVLRSGTCQGDYIMAPPQ